MKSNEIKNIIVPIDFSDESLNGLRFALLFIKHMNANLKLVYVTGKTVNSYPEALRKGEIAWAQSALDAIIRKFKVRLKKGTLSSVVLEGQIYKEIINLAKQENAYAIITAAHGSSGYENDFIGGNANKIATFAECPVITVKQDSCTRGIEKIVVPIDHTIETRQKLPFAAEIAIINNAQINLLVIDNENSLELTRQLKNYAAQSAAYLKSKDIEYVVHFEKGNNTAQITLQYAEKEKANLIMIMTEQEFKATNFFFGQQAQQLVNHSSIPVCCIHPKQTQINTAVGQSVIGM